MAADRREFLKYTAVLGAAAAAAASPPTLAAADAASPTSGAASNAKDTAAVRADLEAKIDAYLEALVANDPGRAPFAPDVVFAENDQALTLGEASWRTINRLGRYRHYFADPETGHAAVIANSYDGAGGGVLVLRIRVENGLIKEADQFVIHDPNGAEAYERLGAPDPVWLEPVPPELRQSREALEAAAYMYFQALERNDGGGIYPFREDCERLEHARPTVNQKNLEGYGHADTNVEFITLKAKEQYELGMMAFVSRVRDRQAVVVDVERGVVLAQSSFDFDGLLKTIHLANGVAWTIPPYFRSPRTHRMNEAFKVMNGSFRHIEMTLLEVPFSTRPVFRMRQPTVRLDYARPAPPATPIGTSDRAALMALVERTLGALIQGCPSLAPLADDVRYTENGVAVQSGEGLWWTMTAKGAFGVTLADPDSGQAGWFGTLKEDALFAAMAMRLRVESGLISELELVIARPEKPGSREKLSEATFTMFMAPLIADLNRDGFAETDPSFAKAGAGLSSAELKAVVDGYHRAFVARKGDLAPLAKGCRRRENGIAASDNKEGVVLDPARPDFRLFRGGVKEELDAGYLSSFAKLRAHRSLVLDREMGLVLDLATLDNSGAHATVDVKGVGDVALPPSCRAPWTDLHAQLFKIGREGVERIEGIVRRVPYGQKDPYRAESANAFD